MKTERFVEMKRFMRLFNARLQQNDMLLHSTTVGSENFKESYTKNFLAVCQYVAAVNKSGLPALVNPVPAWEEFSTLLVEAKAATLEWTNSVAVNLQSLPHSILRKNGEMTKLFDEAIQLCEKLIENPRSSRIEELHDTIDDLLRNIESINSRLTDLLSLLEDYHDSLPVQAEKLQNLADKSLMAKEVDEKKVKELKLLVTKAKAEISSLSAAIAGMSVAIAASILISVVAVATAGPVGCLSFVFTGIVIGTSIAYIVMDAKKIEALKDQISQTQNSMDDYTADAAALQLLADGFNDLAKQAADMEGSVKFIVRAWEAMRNDLQVINSEVKHAQDLWAEQEWAAMKQDFEEAAILWKQFIEKAGLYDLDNVKACNCNLELGMSEEDVKAAVEKNGTIDLIDYLTA